MIIIGQSQLLLSKSSFQFHTRAACVRFFHSFSVRYNVENIIPVYLHFMLVEVKKSCSAITAKCICQIFFLSLMNSISKFLPMTYMQMVYEKSENGKVGGCSMWGSKSVVDKKPGTYYRSKAQRKCITCSLLLSICVCVCVRALVSEYTCVRLNPDTVYWFISNSKLHRAVHICTCITTTATGFSYWKIWAALLLQMRFSSAFIFST